MTTAQLSFQKYSLGERVQRHALTRRVFVKMPTNRLNNAEEG